MNDVETITLKKSTIKWLDFGSLGDLQRGKARAAAARRLIEFWEDIKDCREWTAITSITGEREYSQQRWVRRNLYTFSNAGLVEVRRPKVKFKDCVRFRVIWPSR